MPERTASRPVAAATRVGVQDGSVYILVKDMPPSAMASMLGAS